MSQVSYVRTETAVPTSLMLLMRSGMRICFHSHFCEAIAPIRQAMSLPWVCSMSSKPWAAPLMKKANWSPSRGSPKKSGTTSDAGPSLA